MKILIVRNDYNAQAIDASLLAVAYLSTQHIEYEMVDSSALVQILHQPEECERLIAEVDLVVALGGDGTILRVAHLVESRMIPILGLNYGRLGFLANSNEGGVVPAIAAALSGDVAEERRANLRVDVVCDGEADPFDGGFDEPGSDAASARESDSCALAGQVGRCASKSLFAFNEVSVMRGAFGRMIDFELGVSGSRIANMRGDGVVVATATGSCAYALSAGGPLVSPGFNGLVVVPVAPHTLHSRAIVTSEADVAEVTLSPSVAYRESVVFVDGELMSFENPVHRVYVRRGDVPTILLRYRRESFYEQVSRAFF